MSREYTEEEVKSRLIAVTLDIIEYWENLPNKTVKERLDGVVFSVLSTLDGESPNLPGFILAPCPHPNDKDYCIGQNRNWYPQNHDALVQCDIAGSLHELFCKMKRDK